MGSIGILGVGTYLPDQVRRNDYWDAETIAAWRERAARRLERIREQFGTNLTEGTRLVKEALEAIALDPFQGGIERRVMDAGMSASQMEASAARVAIARAGIDPQDIGIVLSNSLCVDYVNSPTACAVHAQLGLRPNCIAMNVDAVCNSFIMQLMVARGLLADGRERYALLTQSSAITRITPSGDQHDAWMGDGAGAVVVGAVPDGKGILGYAHRVDGTLNRALILGVPGKRWFDDGAVIAHSEDHAANFNMVEKIADRARDVLLEALAQAKLEPENVDFYACHQAFLWLRRLTQQHAGLKNARWVDTFERMGTISSANLPLVLSLAERDGLLRDNDVVACFQGGTGMTWSAMMMRWHLNR
jgi:3-oxoacyl-[acyl-carrier-protein] synthase-3